MSEAIRQPQIEPTILISNLSLPLGVQMLGGLDRTAEYLDQIGVKGMELTPSKRGRFMGAVHERARALEAQDGLYYRYLPQQNRDVVVGKISGLGRSKDESDFDRAMAGIVRSLHSSPRDATDGRLDPVGRIMFPHFEHSLRTMNYVQRMVGQKLPAVVFPRFGGRDVWYNEQIAPFKEVLFQPKPADWRWVLGLEEGAEIGKIQQTMNERGLKAITWATFHSQNPQELFPHGHALRKREEAEGQKYSTHLAFQDPLTLASRLAAAGLVHSVHVEIGRKDCAEKGSDMARRTEQARVAFADPESSDAASKTLEGEMLSEIARNWKVGEVLPTTIHPTVVVEMLPSVSSAAGRREQAAVVRNIGAIIAAA